jgi:hypothetical protein
MQLATTHVACCLSSNALYVTCTVLAVMMSRVAECQSGRVAEWQNGRVAEWHSGRVAQWHSENLHAALNTSDPVGLNAFRISLNTLHLEPMYICMKTSSALELYTCQWWIQDYTMDWGSHIFRMNSVASIIQEGGLWLLTAALTCALSD